MTLYEINQEIQAALEAAVDPETGEIITLKQTPKL